ncbi:MAG: class I SAM-dependent methyltransferase [Candidatus Magasanikiibacteriota bacterium]
MKYQDRFQDNKEAVNYDENEYGNNSYSNLIWKIEKEYIELEVCKISRNDYLDFACGTGRVISQIEKMFEYSLGVDISPAMISLARQKVKSNLVVLDISKENLTRKFDLITAFRFFLNLDDDLKDSFVKILKKYLKQNGIMIITIQRNKNLYNSAVSWLFKVLKNVKLNEMSYDDIQKLFERNEMNIIRCKGIGVMPKFLYRIFILRYFVYMLDRFFAKKKLFQKQANTFIYTLALNEK